MTLPTKLKMDLPNGNHTDIPVVKKNPQLQNACRQQFPGWSMPMKAKRVENPLSALKKMSHTSPCLAITSPVDFNHVEQTVCEYMSLRTGI